MVDLTRSGSHPAIAHQILSADVSLHQTLLKEGDESIRLQCPIYIAT